MEDQTAYMTDMRTAEIRNTGEGLKFDDGKQEWFELPLDLVEPLADVFVTGAKEYGLLNCLKPFAEPSKRFYNANMRHNKESQYDPLARDAKSGHYHLAHQAANCLMRLYHARKEAGQ